MRFALVLTLLLFSTPAFADSFSAGNLTLNVTQIYVHPNSNQLTLEGGLVNRSTNTTVTVTTIKWADDSTACANCLSRGKFLILFNWTGTCKGSYFAYVSFPNASVAVSPIVMGNTLTLDLLTGSDCNGALGPQKFTLTSAGSGAGTVATLDPQNSP